MKDLETKEILGLKVTVFTLESLKKSIVTNIKEKKKIIFYGYSLVLLPRFKTNPEIYTYSNDFDLFVADGKGMYWLFKLGGAPLQSDISLPDLANIVLEIADENKFSVFLLGAESDINIAASQNVRNKYSNAVILEGAGGYFSEKEEEEVVEKINKLNPDILLIGISSPKKERFTYEWRSKLNATIIIPCGGVIDVLAGKTRREPKLIKKAGLTWLYRFMQEPARLFRPVFVNGLMIIFLLLPAVFINFIIKGNKNFSIPEYFGVKNPGNKN